MTIFTTTYHCYGHVFLFRVIALGSPSVQQFGYFRLGKGSKCLLERLKYPVGQTVLVRFAEQSYPIPQLGAVSDKSVILSVLFELGVFLMRPAHYLSKQHVE